MIFVLLIWIFLMSGDLSLSVSLLCFISICCFMALMSERWWVRRWASVVVVWVIGVELVHAKAVIQSSDNWVASVD